MGKQIKGGKGKGERKKQHYKERWKRTRKKETMEGMNGTSWKENKGKQLKEENKLTRKDRKE